MSILHVRVNSLDLLLPICDEDLLLLAAACASREAFSYSGYGTLDTPYAVRLRSVHFALIGASPGVWPREVEAPQGPVRRKSLRRDRAAGAVEPGAPGPTSSSLP